MNHNEFKINPGIKKIALIILLISIIIQFILVFNFNGEQVSDSAGYLKLAQLNSENHTFYPSQIDRQSNYIQAPGYVNYLSLIYSLFKNFKVVFYFNIILLLILNFEIFYLGRKYFSERVAWISLLISIFYTTNYGIILYAGTELIFTTLAFGCICLYSKDNLTYSGLAAILLGLANWIRPFLPVFIVIIILMTLIMHGRKILNISVFVFSLSLTLLSIGLASYKSCGFFLVQSSTSGVNLMMGANDEADGSYNESASQKGEGRKMVMSNTNGEITFKDRDAYWRNLAIEWIKENPGKYVMLFPKKLFYMYAHDFYSFAPLSGDMKNNVGGKDYTVKTINDFPKLSTFQWFMVFNLLCYALILFLSVYGLFLVWKAKNKMAIVIGTCWVLGTCMTILTFGSPRYHYPYIPVMILMTAYAISVIMFRVQEKKMTIKP